MEKTEKIFSLPQLKKIGCRKYLAFTRRKWKMAGEKKRERVRGVRGVEGGY